MAAIYTVSDGDIAVAADLNQLVSALLNQFTLTDTSQVALGRLVIPRVLAADAPGSPVTGQTWFVTDEGSSGRLYIRHNADDVPYLPCRQIIKSSALGSPTTFNNTSLTDTGLSVSITTSGGRLKIYMVPGITGGTSQQGLSINADSVSENFINAWFRAVVGATNLDVNAMQVSMQSAFIDTMTIPVSSFRWDYQPAAGSYTVKIQVSCSTGTETTIAGGTALIVEEWGD